MYRAKKIGYVDAVKLMSQYKGMDIARKELEERSQAWRANVDTLQAELNSSVEEYNRTKGKASARENKLLEELIATKERQLQDYQQTVSEQFQKQDQEMSVKLLDKVNSFIKRYGEQHKYDIIFSATPYGNIVHGDASVDLTEEIVKGLNQDFKK
jgi:outer membrane protein